MFAIRIKKDNRFYSERPHGHFQWVYRDGHPNARPTLWKTKGGAENRLKHVLKVFKGMKKIGLEEELNSSKLEVCEY